VNQQPEDLVGRTVLGRYKVVTPLGQGGQGMVYLARGEGAAGFARPVVVKRVLAPFATDPQVLDQFAREARITSQLRHPDIVSVIDFERDGVSYVMVLEYVHGYDVRRWERFVMKERKQFPGDIIAYVLMRTLEALHYAHTLRAPDGTPRHVVHRDISPANVLIDLDGHIKLTDFGIARMSDEEVTVVTTGMQIKGKLPYVAPELYKGAQPSVSTDVYACGVMLHELLMGKNEFRATNAFETLALASDHIPTRVDVARDDLSADFADVVAKSLAKRPEDRYQSALEFAQALRDTMLVEVADVESRFREMLRQDFNNPEMARFLGSPPLSELDSAWRNATEITGQHPPISRILSSGEKQESTLPEFPLVTAPTIIDSPLGAHRQVVVATEPPPPRSLRPTAAAPWMYVVLAASVGLAAVFAWRSSRQEAPKFVYVQREANAALGEEPEPTAQPAAPAATPAKHVEAKPPAKELTTVQPRQLTEQERAAAMSAAFATKGSQVERCFAQHQDDVGKRTSVQVQFAIDRGGRVTNASMVPDALTATKFGKCVLKAANATKFARQPTPAVIRIPVTARVVR
jgi:serine/threonine protein kinase